VDGGEAFFVRWCTRRNVGWVLGCVSFALLTWTLAASAQHAAVIAVRPDVPDLYTYPLARHVVAMTLLGSLAVLVAQTLLGRGRRATAAVVLAATAAGPMTVLAAPVTSSLAAPGSMDTVWWWHLSVASAALAVLAGWTAAVGAWQMARDDGATVGPSDEYVFLLVGLLGFAGCWNFAWQLQESPGALPAAGWALIAAGVAVAVRHASKRTVATIVALTAAALGATAWAYLRKGGWPGVAGWELSQSPVILSARVVAVLALAPLTGLVLRAHRGRSRIATSSTCSVIGKRSKTRSDARSQPAST
jgi:hypothetical protein